MNQYRLGFGLAQGACSSIACRDGSKAVPYGILVSGYGDLHISRMAELIGHSAGSRGL